MWSSIKQNWSSARDSSSGVPTDVTFQVQDEGENYEVKAHKYFLALVSPVFKTHCFGPFGGNQDSFNIDAPVEAVKAMIDYIYLEEDLGWEVKSFEDLFEIGCLADKYDVAGMLETVKDCVEKKPVSLHSVVEAAHIANKFFYLDDLSKLLLSKCTKFLSQVLCSHVLDFSGLFSSSEFVSSAAMLHSLVLEVELSADCSNCEHFPCLHGQLIPAFDWKGSDSLKDFPGIVRGCLVTDEDGVHWTVFEFEDEDLFLHDDGESEGEVLLFARKTTFTTEGKPHLHEDDDAQIILKKGHPANVYYDCKKLGGAVGAVYLPDEDSTSESD